MGNFSERASLQGWTKVIISGALSLVLSLDEQRKNEEE
jgi:hypothetical protein